MTLRTFGLVLVLAAALGCRESISAPTQPIQSTAFVFSRILPPPQALVPGTTVSDGLENDGSYSYVGEAYESDYCSACKFYTLRTPVDGDVRIDVQWAGTPQVALWCDRAGVITVGEPKTGSGTPTLSLTVPRGSEIRLIVGTPFPTKAPAVRVAFTIASIVLPSGT